MNSDDVKELVRNYLETYRTNANILIDFIEQQSARLEAAEKVCDAADIVIKKPGQIKAHWNLTKAMMAWQEVKRCADQQQKK